MGELEKAEMLLHECLTLARKYGEKDRTASALVNLGWALILRRDIRGISLCQEALAISQELDNKYSISFCLEGIAGGLVLAEKFERAVRLFGAASALRDMIGIYLNKVNARSIETMVQPARYALSHEVFASAWAEGEAMSLEQAIECALHQSSKNSNP